MYRYRNRNNEENETQNTKEVVEILENNENENNMEHMNVSTFCNREKRPLQNRIENNETLSTTDDEDFGSSSSDDFIIGTDENADSSYDSIPTKKKKKKNNQSKNIIIEETELSSSETEDIPRNEGGCSFWESNGMTDQRRKKKPRKSEKERREDRIKRQLFRNKGLEYTTRTGKIKRSRELRDLNNCRQKCKERLPQDLRRKLFDEYWNLGSYIKRAAYMEKCIVINKKKSCKSSPKKCRTFSNHYYVSGNDLQNIRICKSCFLRTFDESHRFLQTVYEKKKIYGSIPPRQRRRNKTAVPEEKLEEIKAHILSFPCTESHYGRSKTTKRFLNSELTLQKLYDLFKGKTENPVSKTIFTMVFKGLNLSFKKPSVDTCSKCDSLNMKMKYAIGEEAIALKEQLETHQAAYQAAYEQKRRDKEQAKFSKDLVVVTFDLQQCLPTPFLKTNVAFYKRQLWTYNLTIHDLKSNKAFCYMWPECTGGRGANDIASCLYDFIINQLPLLYPTAKHLIMYSDSCPGQNKNSIVTTMIMMAAKLSPQLHTIEHKFLIPGHTHMEADSDHALIERKKKRTNMDIHLPRDWYQLVRTASNKSSKLTVIEMKQDMFYDFGDFAKQYLTLKKTNQNNSKFIWAKVRCFKYKKDSFPAFFYKEVLESTTNYLSMDYAKRGKDYNSLTIDVIKKCYAAQIPISAEKKKDLMDLLPFIHESTHAFYRSLSCKPNIKDTAPYDDDSSQD